VAHAKRDCGAVTPRRRRSAMTLDSTVRVTDFDGARAYNRGMATTDNPETVDGVDEWRRDSFESSPERTGELFSTMSGVENEPLYAPDNVDVDYDRDLGYPGAFPFTRGVYPSMYRGRLWTMRQFAGFGTVVETNERFRYLLEHGQTGLSTAFDMPTLMGYDSDHPRSLGEVGREGVAVDSLDDMETLFAGIPLGDVSTSMTINSPAAMLLAFYACVGEEQGVSIAQLRGTVQTDILKEYIAQKEWIFPPEPSLRLVVDMIEWCAREMPLMHPVSISGYHIREAGSTAAQELAFTLADGFAYVDACVARGLDVDEFAPRLSFFFNAHLDFFEEIAKYRAARRIWATQMRDKYGAKDPRSWLMRFHAQTAGVSLTAQQPEVNLIRTAIEALAAVLGGTQSLHTNSFDEALALPTENAVRLALRTQQVIAHETGVVNTIDPLGGSYYLEQLTNELERQAYDYFDRIEKLGGVIAAIKENFFQREIAEASFRYQSEVEKEQRIVVGVNRYVHDDEQPLEILRIDPALEQTQVARVQALRARRDSAAVEAALARLKSDAAHTDRNLMPPIIDAARVYTTMGEMCDALREVWGVWRETPVF
jgi:methylmalonyl-CoA mutase N-terminal domain/subunit